VHDTSSPTLGDVIRRFGASLIASYGETMTTAQKAVLSLLGRCRTAALGGHLYRCEHCGAEHPRLYGLSALTLKIRRKLGTGVSLSIKYRNAMGIERPAEPNETAQLAAKELYALHMGYNQTLWDMLEVRFTQTTKDDAPPVVTCQILKDTDKDKQKKKA
jgi:hypothetical protein